jgi:hypothetical protein
MPKRYNKVLTGSELKFAALNNIPVHYKETYVNPHDRHMNFNGVCVMEKAKVGYYIGNADINPSDYSPSDKVEGEFPEGTFAVYGVEGQTYK